MHVRAITHTHTQHNTHTQHLQEKQHQQPSGDVQGQGLLYTDTQAHQMHDDACTRCAQPPIAKPLSSGKAFNNATWIVSTTVTAETAVAAAEGWQ
jgi:hypothetical protein